MQCFVTCSLQSCRFGVKGKRSGPSTKATRVQFPKYTEIKWLNVSAAMWAHIETSLKRKQLAQFGLYSLRCVVCLAGYSQLCCCVLCYCKYIIVHRLTCWTQFSTSHFIPGKGMHRTCCPVFDHKGVLLCYPLFFTQKVL